MASSVKVETEGAVPSSVAPSQPEAAVAPPPQKPLLSRDGTLVRVVTEITPRGNIKKEPEAHPVQSDDGAAAPPSKKVKVEGGGPFLEIRWYKDEEDTAKWENGTYHRGELRTHEYSIFADELPKRTKFNKSCVFTKGEFEGEFGKEGENHEYSLTICLVDSKADDRKVLVEIGVYYWILPINLMHFHILSQDLANFSRKLWVAAGRNEDVYDDMSIEFGYSKHGKVAVKSLVSKATGIKGKSDVIYVRNVKVHEGSSEHDSRKLLEMVFKLCSSASVIAYKVDLEGLGVYDPETASEIGFAKMPNFDCFIGPNRKF
ncbi:hypothetical protein ACHAXT_005063 [Thalassiosira profunda]